MRASWAYLWSHIWSTSKPSRLASFWVNTGVSPLNQPVTASAHMPEVQTEFASESPLLLKVCYCITISSLPDFKNWQSLIKNLERLFSKKDKQNRNTGTCQLSKERLASPRWKVSGPACSSAFTETSSSTASIYVEEGAPVPNVPWPMIQHQESMWDQC